MTAPRWLRIWWLGRQIHTLLLQIDACKPEKERLGLITQAIELQRQRTALRGRR